MKMPRESFLIYFSFEDMFRELTLEERSEMLFAFFDYHRTGEEPKFSSRDLRLCWITFKNQFDRDAAKYENVCNRNRRNGMNGGRPAKPKEPTGFFNNPNNPNEPKKPDTDTDTDTDINKKSIINTPKSVFGFDEFWDAYDKKTGRKNCEKLYAKIPEQDRAKIKAHVPQYVAATPDKKYRKDPQTYLNGKCWEDEIITNNGGGYGWNGARNNGNADFDRKNRATYPGDENAGKELTHGF